MRGTGADRPVVAMRPGNAVERRGRVVRVRLAVNRPEREEPGERAEAEPFEIS
jgi:hypothetical protein